MKIRDLIGDPVVMRRITAVLIPVSIIEWAAATAFGWVNSVAYVSHLSQLAITVSLIPWWQGLRLEVRAVEENVATDVVDHLVQTTTVERQEDR